MALPTDEDEVNTAPPASDGSSTVLPGGIVSPEGTTDPNAMLRQATTQLYQALQSSNQPVQLPSLRRSPSDGTRPGWLGLLGEALSGGQTPLYHLSGQQEDLAGSRALMNFGINMMLASGPNRVRPSLFGAAASGLQGAQESMDRSQQLAYTQAGQQFQQQKEMADLQMQQQQNRIRTLQAALPLLTLQARTNMPSLYGGGGTGTGTAGAGGQPGDVGKAVLANGGTPYDAWVADREGIAPNQGALGYGQFRPSTWNAFAAANPDLFKGMTPDQILAARTDPATATKAMAWLRGQNGSALSTANVPVTGQTLGMSHYLGAGTVAKLWNASDTDPVSKYVSADAVKLNPELGTMTVGDMKKRYAGAPDPNAKVATGPQPTVVATAPPAAPPVSKGDTGQTAPPGVQIGGAPPPPPGGSTGPYAGGGIGSALAPAVAGSPIPAGRLQTTGKPPGVAGDVGAILRGQQLAQSTPVIPGTGLVTGPSTIGAPAKLATTTPWGGPPGAAPTIGNYNDTPATPARSTATPPVVPAAQPSTQQPTPTPAPAVPTPAAPGPLSKNPDGTFTIPDEKLPSVLDYQARYRHVPSPEEMQQRGLVLPDNPQAVQTAYAGVQEAEREAAAAHTAADSIMRTGIGGTDASRAIQAANAADKNAADARNAYTNLIQGANEKNAAALQSYYKDQDATLAGAYDKIQDRIAASALETQRGKQQIAQTDESQRIQYINTQQGKLDEEAAKSRDNLWQLQMLGGLSNAAGSANPVGEMEIGGRSVRDWLLASGIGTPSQVATWTAQDAFKAAVTKFAQDMRAGQGMGRLTNQELTVLMQMLPNVGMDQGAREAILDYMGQLYQRKSDFALHTANHLSDTDQGGKPINFSAAMDAADKELGPILPAMDPKQIKTQQDYNDWLSAGNVAPNRFFREPNGHMAIYHGQVPVQQ
jgi:hypothetical protein